MLQIKAKTKAKRLASHSPWFKPWVTSIVKIETILMVYNGGL
jgi:hypothetical protein